MEIGALSGANQTSKADQSFGNLAEDFDNFLLLLTTQLKNQDPTSPMDTDQFTQQITAFAGVEQQLATNKNLESLIAIQNGTQVSSAASFIGRIAEVKSPTFALSEGQTEAYFSYTLDGPAEKVFVTITDEAGRAVFNSEGNTGIGRHNITWDGTDRDGNPVETGNYNVKVTMETAEGNIEDVTEVYTAGQVTGVDLAGGGVQLVLTGGIPVAFENVQFVGQVARAN